MYGLPYHSNIVLDICITVEEKIYLYCVCVEVAKLVEVLTCYYKTGPFPNKLIGNLMTSGMIKKKQERWGKHIDKKKRSRNN